MHHPKQQQQQLQKSVFMFFKETLHFVSNLKIPVCHYICRIMDSLFYIFLAASLCLIQQHDHSAWHGLAH
jgi:hypothetical protein